MDNKSFNKQTVHLVAELIRLKNRILDSPSELMNVSIRDESVKAIEEALDVIEDRIRILDAIEEAINVSKVGGKND
jgi:hypothetical protein